MIYDVLQNAGNGTFLVVNSIALKGNSMSSETTLFDFLLVLTSNYVCICILFSNTAIYLSKKSQFFYNCQYLPPLLRVTLM